MILHFKAIKIVFHFSCKDDKKNELVILMRFNLKNICEPIYRVKKFFNIVNSFTPNFLLIKNFSSYDKKCV